MDAALSAVRRTVSLLASIGLAWLLVPLATSACGSHPAPSSASGSGGSGAGGSGGGGAKTGDLASSFATAGFQVGRGTALRFGIPDCSALPTCFGANPTSPYLLFAVPPPPGQSLPSGILSLVPNVPSGQGVGFPLSVDEAIVITGTAPPSARYFSITPYLFSRNNVSVFSELSDPTNQLVMAQPVFGQPMTFVAASDSGIDQRVRAVLVANGVSAERISSIVFPQSIAHLTAASTDAPTTDILALLGRVALFDDETAGEAYLAKVPLSVYRLTPTVAGTAKSPEPQPTPRPEGTGTTENAYAASFAKLAAAVMAGFPGKTVMEVTMETPAQHDMLESPANCIDNLLKCNGGDRDAAYSIGPVSATGARGYVLTDTEIVAVIGVNHRATGKATYSNVIAGNGSRNTGVLSIDDVEMPGSADAYLPGDPDADKLFAWFFARDCQGQAHCTNIPVAFPGVAEGETFYVASRAYVEAQTKIEPLPAEIISERVFRILP